MAGLAAARRLHDAGVDVRVLDKSRGLGGRCATRRVRGRTVDHGAPFLHGRDPELLALAQAVPGPRRDGWPERVVGSGAPCHPDSFAPGGFRCAWPAGMTALAKHLGRDLQVDRQQHVEALAVEGERWVVTTRAGARVAARELVMALPVEQALVLLESLDAPRALAPAKTVLGWFLTEPALSLLAGYPEGLPAPGFDVHLPPRHPVLQQIVHDSAKRPGDGGGPVLVLHARPEWSAAWLERPLEEVAEALLTAAADVVGPWAAAPEWSVPHRWRYARVPAGLGLAAPLRMEVEGRPLVLTGEVFDRAGGLEGAWRAGRAAAHLLLNPGDET